MTDMTTETADIGAAKSSGSETGARGQLLAADGTPLKRKLAQSLFRQRVRAFGLTLPLLAFIVVFFVVPIISFLTQAGYDPRFSSLMPNISAKLADWDPATEPTEEMAAALVADLVVAREEKTIGRVATRVNRELSGTRSLFTKTARRAAKMEAPFMEALIDRDDEWADIEVWRAMKTASKVYTMAYIAASLDMKVEADGDIVWQEEERRIHLLLFYRTLEISFLVTVFCLILGYPVAYLMSVLPLRTSNLLLILVLLPFWTSLLVRTTAWIAMLQAQGVMNDLFVVFGLAADEDRFSLIYNKTGTLIAMTHILLPFMILPLYSVMK
ncbi:MAG: ABC transporter permease, partial [Pseudomonadota bacterium]